MTYVDTRLQIDLDDWLFFLEEISDNPGCIRRGECRSNNNQTISCFHHFINRQLPIVMLTVRLIKEHTVWLHRFFTFGTQGHVICLIKLWCKFWTRVEFLRVLLGLITAVHVKRIAMNFIHVRRESNWIITTV